MAQVIRNLLANAIRLSPSGQVVEVRAQPQGATLIELRVADRGPGIPPAEIERIFDPFVQSSITKGQSGSTGLGLAISQRIVQAHGGSITAHNRDGGGAVFTVLLEAVHIGELRPSPIP
jgi:signal transduction histidine kinase